MMPGCHPSSLIFHPFRLAAVCCLLLAGCGDSGPVFTEVKRPHEKVTEKELQQFLRVINALPEKKLPEFTPTFLPPPRWSNSRTLPIGDLVSEAQTELNDRWNVEWPARQLSRRRSLQRVLRREKLTTEQFVGLALAIGIALSRETIREDQDLEKMIETARREVEQLKADERPFQKLTPERKHEVLTRAVWVTRLDRARRLAEVPPENLKLVRDHAGELAGIFPAYFTTNPLDELADPLQTHGMPFAELPDSGIEELGSWKMRDPIIGYDAPDPEFVRSILPVNTITPGVEDSAPEAN